VRLKATLATLAAVIVTAVGLLLPASADLSRVTYDCPAVNGQPGYDNNGSGCLDPLWTTRAHGQYGNLAGPDVMLVGDSITTLCKAYMTSRLQAQNLTWGVSYWSGRPTKPAVDWMLSLSVKPKVVVMAIGTNDIYNTAGMAAQIQRLVNGLPGVRIMWVDVRAERPAFAVADMRNSRAVNQQIWDNPAVTPVRWMGWFDDQPSRRVTYIDKGGVHPIATVGCDFWGAATAPTIIGAAKAAKLKASVPR
jgi:hypothetical protein